jgi:hypothetical protein
MPLYFAYGSNMDVEAMRSRCPQARPIGLARLERHRLAVMSEGWLTAVRSTRSAVYGLLWDLTLADVPALDRYEGVSRGLYVKAVQPVVAEGGPKRALIYFGANAGPGVAKPAYLAGVIAAARACGAPTEGLEALGRPAVALADATARRKPIGL